MKNFEFENISGFTQKNRIHIKGSGRLLAPYQANDWLRTNFAICSTATCHFGFLVAAMRLFRGLRDEFRDWDHVVITGHSMGGAVAEILGLLIGRNTNMKVEVHNFGGPGPWSRRAVPKMFRSAVGTTKNYWYSCGNDPVPFLLPWNYHLGEWVHLPRISLLPWKNHITGYVGAIEDTFFAEKQLSIR